MNQLYRLTRFHSDFEWTHMRLYAFRVYRCLSPHWNYFLTLSLRPCSCEWRLQPALIRRVLWTPDLASIYFRRVWKLHKHFLFRHLKPKTMMSRMSRIENFFYAFRLLKPLHKFVVVLLLSIWFEVAFYFWTIHQIFLGSILGLLLCLDDFLELVLEVKVVWK